jgi:GT2 family glycosyltransferase/glycosyltransferase involved in cell wall biosynthesis
VMKCDVIIPVFNAPDWVKLCVQRLVSQTPEECLNQIILVDDASNAYTREVLAELARNYAGVVLVRNEENSGFVKSVNRGFSLTTAPNILLLNSDCLITKNTIPKLIAHTEAQDRVGLVSPVSNHSPVVTLEMSPGFSFIDMNDLAERLFPQMSFPACTIVGNCLLITRSCLDQTGLFDLCWGRGYGEETDYQFRAMQKGFKARIAIDTYVYHKSEASFTIDAEAESLRRNHYRLFMEKWGEEYRRLSEQYEKNDPIVFMRESIKEYLQNEGSSLRYDAIYCLPGISQTVGGVHTVVDIINYLILKELKIGLVVGPDISPFYDKMFFNYLTHESLPDFLAMPIQTAAIVATSWNTVYPCSLFASLKNIPLVYFIQGYEVAFRNGINYGPTESTYDIADDLIVTSHWLHDKLLSNFSVQSRVIPNGYDDAIFHPDPERDARANARRVTMILRGSVEKGDWVLMDLMKSLLGERDRNIEINMIYFSDVAFGDCDGRLHPIKGPLSRLALSDLLRQTDIFVDASLHEGFGLFPMEAMACGAVPVVSDSGGISQFIFNGRNGLIINEVNKVEKYVEAVKRLIDDPVLYQSMKTEGSSSLKTFSVDHAFKAYESYFRNVGSLKKKELNKKIGAFHVRNMDLDTHEHIECFIDTGGGFSAAHSKSWKFDAKQEKIILDLRAYTPVCSIRFDPLNNLVKIRLKRVTVFCRSGGSYDVPEVKTNALFVDDSTYLFGNDDPQIIIPIRVESEPEKLVLEVSYLLRGKEVFAELLARCQMSMQLQENQLQAKGNELQAKGDELQAKDLAMRTKDGELLACNAELQTRDAAVQAKNMELHEMNQELRAREGVIRQLTEEMKHSKEVIDLIRHSRSWKLTRPLRMVTALLHGGEGKE